MSISDIKKACNITDKIFRKLAIELKKHSFKTEKDIEIFLRKETKKNKCYLSYRPIVATGKNGAEIHHRPNDTKIKKGFLVIDYGAKYNGFCSDCTRTYYIGTPSKKDRELYNLVKLAQETSLQYANPGVYAADVDLIARAILQDYFRHFVHSLGHGVGKRVHQAPSLRPRSKSILKENQIITIEPGLYFKNKCGLRIEDTVIVKNNPVQLTKTTKELITI